MKTRILLVFVLLVIVNTGCTPTYIDTEDDIVDIHEKEIKSMYIDYGYTESSVVDLEISYVGEVNNYLFYKVDEYEKDDYIKLSVGSDFPSWINKVYFVFDKQNKLHYPLEGMVNDPRLYDYIEEVESLINGSEQ